MKETKNQNSRFPSGKMRQLSLLKAQSKSYGGDLLKTREGRKHGRPLSTQDTMHLVLRSSKAKGDWAFSKKTNRIKINQLIAKFSRRYGVKIHSWANVGNHLHFQIRLSHRRLYPPFIRALTAAVAMAVTGASRWNPVLMNSGEKFWDTRPFTRVVVGQKAFLTLKDYIEVNQMEGYGYPRPQAKFYVQWQRLRDTIDDSA